MTRKKQTTFKYPGTRQAMDGNTAVIMCERESTDAAGAYPITPSTQMGEYWAEEQAKGHINISGRPLIFIEPEGEHAAAGVTAGLAMSGLRATNFSSGQGIAYMHESLYAAVGKRLPYILNVGCRAITKATLNVHAGHDDYHAVDDTGFFQVMGKSAQEACDLNVIAHKIAELSLTPGIVGQDGFLTTHLIESLYVPERELIEEYLGRPDDIIETPTPAQKLIYGATRRRIPETWNVDNPMMFGAVQNQDAYMQSVAAQRPYFFDHIVELSERCMEEYHGLTGRRYQRIDGYRVEDADYLIVGHGSMIPTAEAVTDYLREERRLKVGVVNVTMFRPFPGDLLAHVLRGRKGVTVLERTDQPLAEDLPLIREVRTVISKCVENGLLADDPLPWPTYASYRGKQDIPALYSGSYGLGSRDLQPEGIIGAIENMLPQGARKRFFYLSVDFVHDKADTPKQEVYQEQLLAAYPEIRQLSVRGSENPNLMPKNCITVRMHSVGGWGAITTGKNLAMTLFELLDFDIKANPKYGSEKKGQPTTYYLCAASEPIRVNSEYIYVDVVLSPDPNVFSHSNPLHGLKAGGSFIIQSDLESPQAVWQSFPITAQKQIIDNDIKVYFLDAFSIAREEASDPELQFRMQGIAFQGAFFAASPVMQTAELPEKALFQAIRDQLFSKFGGKGQNVVEDNVRVVRRGFDELQEIGSMQLDDLKPTALRTEPAMPVMLKREPVSDSNLSSTHRFWEQTGNFYVRGKGNDNLVDPFIGMSLMPASTGIYRDMTHIRFEYPAWIPEKCTACGDCYSLCPDSAIPGLVNTVAGVFDSVVRRIEKTGEAVKHLRRALRTVEKKMRPMMTEQGDGANVEAILNDAIDQTLADSDLESEEQALLVSEFERFRASVGNFRFALTKPYFNVMEKQNKNSGGLFSITVNPYTCKGCMECVTVCKDEALEIVKQTPAAVTEMRAKWDFWLDLPNISPAFSRIDDIDERIGALETLLLDKRAYGSMVCGDGACLGCGEKTAIHLFTATVEALMQPRVKKHLAYLDELIERLDQHIRIKMADSMNLDDVSTIENAVDSHKNTDLTLAGLSAALEDHTDVNPLDSEWVSWVTRLLAELKDLRWQYTKGVTGRGRASMGIINATGCTSVWGSTFPFNPYPFPWASHLFQDTPSVAMGVFEGHMAKMTDGFKTIRMAELELKGEYNPKIHDEVFTYFDWRDLSETEFLLCPPVVGIGGDGAMYDIGFQNLSRMLMSGMPIKVMVLDTQVYSNTGGQACTSGFIGQVADMTPYGKQRHGKQETRKEMSLIGMAHGTSYVHQGSMSNLTQLLEGYIEGLNSRRPALFNIYAVCQPEHGVADDAAEMQSKLAVESRAYPLLRFNPDLGETWDECCDMEGNPAADRDWPTYKLEYQDDEGQPATMDLPVTFADFALTEGRFRKHFSPIPADTWDEPMTPIAEYIDLDADEQEQSQAFLWAVDKENHLQRVAVSKEIVASTVERRTNWRLLKSLCDPQREEQTEQIAEQVRAEMVQKISASLLEAVGAAPGSGGSLAGPRAQAALAPGDGGSTAPAGNADFEPVWIETPECTTCDECVDINPRIFAYDDDQLAYVVDPKAGSFKDIVRAAEKCTAGAVHPGTPWNVAEKDIDKLIKRAEKFQ